MTDRFDRLRQYRFEWPAIDAVFLLALTRWLIIAVAAAGAVWLATTLLRHFGVRRTENVDADSVHSAGPNRPSGRFQPQKW